ncbi:MAG: 3-phosphoshikimate 1-carboxyvinyltransferase [Lachnospiraceae bacterium]|nr:3-phosphoshikimate 1-carboxyvinyltransferase [Lachnospiraceae bacterium]
MKKRPALKGTVCVPGDKSISHRSVMFGAIAKGDTRISHLSNGADVSSTMSCFRQLGIKIDENPSEIVVHGKGMHGLTSPSETLYAGNSGTTTRLMTGILAGQPFDSVITGDASICRRPMRRIIDPLTEMGACIESFEGTGCAPLTITGKPLHGADWDSPVASAQVKSAIMLAALYADSPTTVNEPYTSRNHTEIMLPAFGASVHTFGTTVFTEPAEELYGQDIYVPGDISSAAFFIAAALITEGSEVLLKDVGINPTRDGIIKAALEMGGDIEIMNRRSVSGEEMADILVRSSSLHGIRIGGGLIPSLIDEIPVIAVMAAAARGTTVIKDAAELKVKESNRIRTMCENLTAMGANVTETADGMIIRGGEPLCGASINTKKDHRIAMSFCVASLISETPVTIEGSKCVDISYPGFYKDFDSLLDEPGEYYIKN